MDQEEKSDTPFEGVIINSSPAPYNKPKLESIFGQQNDGRDPGHRNFKQILKYNFNQVLDDPKRLPGFFHPFFGKDREFTFFGNRAYFTPQIYLTDTFNVKRRFYLNFDIENLVIGAAGGLLVGVGTKQFFLNNGRLSKWTTTKWSTNMENGTATNFQRFAYSSIVTWRVAKRAAIGAVLYDMLKRNAQLERNNKDDWMNAAFAGGISGAVFGFRAGKQPGAISAVLFALCCTLHHLLPSLHSVT